MNNRKVLQPLNHFVSREYKSFVPYFQEIKSAKVDDIKWKVL